ncbi:hypothetical protein SANTM175S_03329 [Streptomyces antimycoticus]
MGVGAAERIQRGPVLAVEIRGAVDEDTAAGAPMVTIGVMIAPSRYRTPCPAAHVRRVPGPARVSAVRFTTVRPLSAPATASRRRTASTAS